MEERREKSIAVTALNEGGGGKSHRSGRYSAERQPHAWLLLFPALALITVFNLLPLARIFIMSLQGGTLTRQRFVGMRNFVFVFADPEFRKAIANTALFAFVVVSVGLVLSMAVAVAINGKLRGGRVFEILFFIPYLTSVIAIGMVFRYLFNGDYGLVNYVLGLFGLGPYDFLNDPKLNMPTLIIFGIWSSLAFNIIILLSGLRGIDKEYYKVADMFGATAWEKFRRITLPQMVPILTFLSIVDFINSFKVYTEVYALFNGKAGIGDSATTAVFYVFNKFYVDNKYGQGMAAAVVLFLVILAFTIIQGIVLRRLAK